MKNLWQKKYTLRAGDFDKYDRIMPSAVLNLFQDAAGQHAEELGLGFGAMLERNFLWVLVRVKYEIILAPVRYQDVLLKTWPLQPHRLNYKREYCMTDENGKILIKGTSEWVIIDSKERKLLSVPDLYPLEDFKNDIMFDAKLSKIRDFECGANAYIVNAGFSDLDVNNHVNNTKYANYVLDAVVPLENEIIKSFQIDYRKEVMRGTKLDIYHAREDGVITAKGQNEDGDIMFACKMELNR